MPMNSTHPCLLAIYLVKKRLPEDFPAGSVVHLLPVHFLGIAEGRPGLGPAAVKGELCNDFGHFVLSDAIFLGRFHMIFQRTIGNALGDEGRDGDDAPLFEGQDIILAPHFAKEDIVVIAGKIRGKGPQLLPPAVCTILTAFFA